MGKPLGSVLAVLFVLLLAATGANLVLTLTRTASACSFYADLSGLPVTLTASGRPSELGVAIIAHSRGAFRGSGCGGELPPPSPTFAHWAPYFHLSPG
jgi:hypothetical protein